MASNKAHVIKTHHNDTEFVRELRKKVDFGTCIVEACVHAVLCVCKLFWLFVCLFVCLLCVCVFNRVESLNH